MLRSLLLSPPSGQRAASAAHSSAAPLMCSLLALASVRSSGIAVWGKRTSHSTPRLESHQPPSPPSLAPQSATADASAATNLDANNERRRRRKEGDQPAGASPDESGASSTPPSVSPLRLYAELSKARLSSLVVFTSGAGYLMAGAPLSWPACIAAVLGTSMAAAAAGTFNQVWERTNDGLMKRTQTRPLPSGKCSPKHALAFGAGMTAASASTLLLGTNPLTAALGVGNVALYSLVYTPLKTRSTLNTAVGAVVGAIPPLMGWAAATGGLLAFEPMLLGAALFWWQFPHFYSLAWNLRKDYARGGYLMVPVVDATGGKKTAWLSLRSSLALSTLPIVSSVLGVTSPMFAVEGLFLNAYFLRLAYRFWRNPNDASARSLFRCSLWYLPVLLVLMVFHSRHWHPKEVEEQAQAQVAESLLPANNKSNSNTNKAFAASVSSSSSSPSATETETAGSDPRYGFKASFNAKDVSDLLQRGVSQAHAWGRALCVHQLVVTEKVTSWAVASQELGRRACKLLFASWTAGASSASSSPSAAPDGASSTAAPVAQEQQAGPVPAAASCPFTGASSPLAAAVVTGAGGGTGVAGVPASPSSDAASALAHPESRCPVVTVEKAVGTVVAQLSGGAGQK